MPFSTHRHERQFSIFHDAKIIQRSAGMPSRPTPPLPPPPRTETTITPPIIKFGTNRQSSPGSRPPPHHPQPPHTPSVKPRHRHPPHPTLTPPPAPNHHSPPTIVQANRAILSTQEPPPGTIQRHIRWRLNGSPQSIQSHT